MSRDVLHFSLLGYYNHGIAKDKALSEFCNLSIFHQINGLGSKRAGRSIVS